MPYLFKREEYVRKKWGNTRVVMRSSNRKAG